MPTVGQITDKISELRSKVAITDGLILHLKTNYLPSDGGDAEMHFTRAADNGIVSASHVESAIADLVEHLDTLKHELHQWENLTVNIPAPTKEAPKEEPVEAKKKAKKDGGRQDHDQPAPADAAAGKDG